VKKKKKNWSKEIPTQAGWYWIKYRNKHGITKCPACLNIFKTGTVLTSAHNDSWVAGPNHGGPELKGWNTDGKFGVDRSLYFGRKIKIPKD